MCVWVPIAMAVASAAQNIMGQKEAAKAKGAMIDQQRLQKIQVVRQMNFAATQSQQDYRNLWDTTSSELGNLDTQALKNKTTLAAGIAESGLEGRSIDAVTRSIEGKDLRARSQVTENYERDYASILGGQYSNWEQGKAAFKGIQEESQKVNVLGNLLSVGTAAGKGYMAGSSMASAYSSATSAPSQASSTSN